MEKVDEYDIAGAEVYYFLNKMPKEKYKKIPDQITSLFEKYQNLDIGKKIDFNKSFDNQEISQIAKDVIFYISYKYLFTEEQKRKTKEQMQINEEKVKEKYDIEKIFQKRIDLSNKQSNNIIEEKQLLNIKKESIFTKLINFIKRIFKK